MIYRADQFTQQTLLSKPETGMSYQFIEARDNRGNNKIFVAYNAEIIVDFDKDFKMWRDQLKKEKYDNIRLNADMFELSTQPIHVLSKSSLHILSSRANLRDLLPPLDSAIKYKRQLRDREAKDAPKEYANGEEMFVRLSAFENDKRIDFKNKRLLSGSYTTTTSDYITCLETNDDPIDRYALPNNDPIQWAFFIKPAKNDSLQRGVVAPNFGKAGGGIEVYFENGTSNGTYIESVKHRQP